MADEQARPLTAGEIAAIRNALAHVPPEPWMALGIGTSFSIEADGAPVAIVPPAGVRERATSIAAFIGQSPMYVSRLLATLDAWRPVLEAVAALENDDMVDGYCWFCQTAAHITPAHTPDCPVTIARRLLGEDS